MAAPPGGRQDGSGRRVVRSGAVAWGTGAGPEGRDLPAAGGTAGPDSEEATWEVPALGHPLSPGSGSADGADDGVVADFRSGPAPGQYAYRPGRSALDAVQRVHRLLNTGHREVVDADLSDYFGQIPHAELMKSLARRLSDGRLLGWIKAWLEMAVEEDDGEGGTRRTNRARRERQGTPQGAPIFPLLSNIYLRRFILGWKVRGYARRFQTEIVVYADDVRALGQAPSATMRAAVERLMAQLRLPINTEKTRCYRVPEEAMEFLGYRIGRIYRRDTGRAYLGTRPSAASVRSLCRRLSELTARGSGLLAPEVVVGRLNRLMTGWANYFILGQVSPAYAAVDRHATRRLRQWLCRKHKVGGGKYVRFPDRYLWQDHGLTRLGPRTTRFPWAKA